MKESREREKVGRLMRLTRKCGIQMKLKSCSLEGKGLKKKIGPGANSVSEVMVVDQK